ncbi:glutathione S-transferase N-terminal domain-containing protein [Hyphococcus flavus]|uniref:glutathione transferase n=1 Tax=Hyphococcus flavus TaxID=1866326 RepID=A0AAF0CEW2_9PROT|nr:glutathione S-transferase N-terminal domain-containing protein [Hyphococcus flavus]WDI30779.1 glutathione S-transferase N-terminal domain-containing protein [Hyphococcus flavus]
MLKLYDLSLADPDVRPSPFCWRAKFAMLHKGLSFETVPVPFADKTDYPNQDHGLVPILIDGEETVCDSENIYAHLESKYEGAPFAQSNGERAAADFYNAWLGLNLFPNLAPLMFVRVHAAAREDDKAYFRKTREKRLGKTLEEAAATPGLGGKVEEALQTLAAPLVRHRFLGGDQPNIADYNVFSVFLWIRVTTQEELFDAPQAVDAWQERMLDLFDGYGRNAKRVS